MTTAVAAKANAPVAIANRRPFAIRFNAISITLSSTKIYSLRLERSSRIFLQGHLAVVEAAFRGGLFGVFLDAIFGRGSPATQSNAPISTISGAFVGPAF